MIRESGDKKRRGCKRRELAHRVFWLALSSLVVQIIDDIVTLVRVIAEQGR
jgi:hypothetical protein